MRTPPAVPPGAEGPGQAVAAARKARGLTQEELARRATVSLSLLRKVERGTRPLTPGVRAALHSALGAARAADDGTAAPERVAEVIPRLREIMDAYDIPPDLPRAPRPLADLRHLTGSATTWRLSSQYARLAAILPALIADLTATALGTAGREQEQAFALLALAYRAADAIADKHGHHDMSGRATELIRWAAARSASPHMEMMSTYVRAELFFSGQHARSGLRVIDSAAGGPAPGGGDPGLLAMRGALCMRGAVLAGLAGRAGMPGEAADRLAQAQAIAQQVPEGVYHGTAFGPASVRVHELALAVETRDVSRAVQLAGQWRPPPALPAERRSHFHIEAARAYCWAGNREQSITELWHARRAAPQHARCNPAVSETIGLLIRGSRKPPPALLRLAAWAAV